MQFHLDVNDGRNKEFLNGFGNNGTNARIAFQSIDIITNYVGQARQVEVPITHLTHFRHRARNRGNRVDKINRVVLVAQVAFIGIGFFAFAALHRAMPHYLTAIQEHAFLSVIELKRALQMQESLFMKTLHKGGRNRAMDLATMAEATALVHIKANVVRIKRCLLAIVVATNIVFQGSLEGTGFNFLAIPLFDRRTEAIGARDEYHVFRADAITEEAGIAVGGYKNAAHMTKVQRLVAIRHACRHNGTLRPLDTFFLILRWSHCSPTPSTPKPIDQRK